MAKFAFLIKSVKKPHLLSFDFSHMNLEITVRMLLAREYFKLFLKFF